MLEVRNLSVSYGGLRALTDVSLSVAEGRFVSAIGDERIAFRMSEGRAVSYQPALNTETLQRAPFTEQPMTLLTAAVLTLFAAVATLIGLAARNRREQRQNQIQARAAIVQAMQAGLWIVSMDQ